MLTLTIKLTWPDGEALTARVEAESPEGEYPVLYSGAATRVPDLFAQDSAPLLAAHLRTMAAKAGAQIEEDWQGNYERHAE